MDEKRMGELLLAAKKAELRKDFALGDIANIRRNAGNAVKEPEMVAVNATSAEIVELATILLEEVWAGQMKQLKGK